MFSDRQCFKRIINYVSTKSLQMYKFYISNTGFWQNRIVKCMIRMNLTTILMVVLFFHVNASTYGQKISLHFSKAPLKDVLNSIQKQADIDFLYNSKLIIL